MGKKGSSVDWLEDSITRAVASGQTTEILRLFDVKSSKKSQKHLHKLLNASENFSVHGDIVLNSEGNTFHGIAFWGNTVTVRMNRRDYRYRLLNLDRLGTQSVYLVPIGTVDSIKSLPGIDLSHAELRLLMGMADTLRGVSPSKESRIRVKHPAKTCLETQTADLSKVSFDGAKLLAILKENPTLLLIAVAALDTQLRGLKNLDAVPAGIHNFVLPGGESDTERWFVSALNTLTFSNEIGAFSSGPINIKLKDSGDLAKCENGGERMVLVRTASGALLWPLLERLEEQERIRKGRGIQVSSPAPPLVLSKGFLQCPQAVDIQLPKKIEALTVEQSHALRAAMSRIINKKTATTLRDRWERTMQSEEAYHLSGFRVWRELLLATLVKTWFEGNPLYRDACGLLEDTEAWQRKEEARREEILHKAFTLLSHPEKYRSEIIDRPASKTEAADRLASDALAFRFTPLRGDDSGTELLAFTRQSLLRLLARVGCSEEFYDAFLSLRGKRRVGPAKSDGEAG